MLRKHLWMHWPSCTCCYRSEDFDEAARVFVIPARSAMTHVSRLRRLLTTSASPQPQPQRQLSMTFEPPILQDMDPSERAAVIAQLAILLLQASGVQAAGSNDDEL